MGVTGLLKALADIQRPTHISEYRGLRVALDGYIFLHRGKYSCARALLAGQSTDAFLTPVLEMVSALRAVGAQPIVVFDGGYLPAKQPTEDARRCARDKALMTLARRGTTSNLSSAVDVSPEMAALCARRMRRLQVEFIVAPYEADAQLAHLAISGRVDVCITEDADLLAFGCPRVLFGVDCNGNGREVRLCDVGKSRGLAPYRIAANCLPELCVLSGCDYLPSIPGVGLKTAAKLLHRSGGNLQRALRLAKLEGYAVSAEYVQRCFEARMVFTSQTVFDLSQRCMAPLRPLPADVQLASDVLGPILPVHTACAIADSRINPITLEEYDSDVDRGPAGEIATQQFGRQPLQDEIQLSPQGVPASQRQPLAVVTSSGLNCPSEPIEAPRGKGVQSVSHAPPLAIDAENIAEVTPDKYVPSVVQSRGLDNIRGGSCNDNMGGGRRAARASAAVTKQFRPPRSITPASSAATIGQTQGAQGTLANSQCLRKSSESAPACEIRDHASSPERTMTQVAHATGAAGYSSGVWADFNRAQCTTVVLGEAAAPKRRRIGCRIAACA